ncbi:MAG: hypothetical protein AAB424_00075 [Patescibacteria group bacterium]
MLPVFALAAVLSTDSVNINDVHALKNLDSVLTTYQVVLTDTPTVIIQSGDVNLDSVGAAFQFARRYLRGEVSDVKKVPGYEQAIVVVEHPEPKTVKVYVLLCHDDGNLPEIIFRNTGDLGVLELTYITREGMVIAVEKL